MASIWLSFTSPSLEEPPITFCHSAFDTDQAASLDTLIQNFSLLCPNSPKK